MSEKLRDAKEIVARVHACDDPFGFAQEVLITALPFEHAREFLKDGTDPSDWPGMSAEDVRAEARGYLDFAVGKALGHRGLSASRSVTKLTEYAWVLCEDAAVAAIEAAPFPQYGAPKLMAFARTMGWEAAIDDLSPEDVAEFKRMANGARCVPGCGQGCGE